MEGTEIVAVLLFVVPTLYADVSGRVFESVLASDRMLGFQKMIFVLS